MKRTEYELSSQHPGKSVADHEVLVSFSDDADGIGFYEWLEDEGMRLFDEWRSKQKDLI